MGFRVIPLYPRSKIPLIKWSQIHTDARIQYLFEKNPQANVGIRTGRVSRLIVIDIDNPARAKEIMREIMENPASVFNTTCVVTGRGIHLYYRMRDGLKGLRNKKNESMEMKADGGYCVAPPSLHPGGAKYHFIIPLSEIKVFREDVFLTGQERKTEVSEKIGLKRLRYNGRSVDCIRQILNRDLQVGERDQSFFVLFHLLCQNGNSKDYAMRALEFKNKTLANPLKEKELEVLQKLRYNLSCKEVKARLSYINCQNCRYVPDKIKKMINGQKYWQAMEQLNPMEFKVYMVFQTAPVKNKSMTEISQIFGISRQTLGRVRTKLLKEGYLEHSEI